MSVLKELFSRFGLDFDPDGFTKADSALLKLKVGAAVVAGAVTAAATALDRMISSVAQTGADVLKVSEQVSVSANNLQELRYAMERSEGEAWQLDDGLLKLSKTVKMAAEGNKDAEAAFRRLHVSVRDADGGFKSADEVLMEVADRFADLPEGVERTNLALDLFGRSGTEMIPLLVQGRDGIAELREQAHEFGRVLGDDVLAAAKRYQDANEDLEHSVQGLKNEIAGPLIDGANDWKVLLAQLIRENRRMIATAVVGFVRGLSRAVLAVAAAFKRWVVDTGLLRIGLIALGQWLVVLAVRQVAAYVASLVAAAAAQGLVGTGALVAGAKAAAGWLLALAPIALVVAALLALALVVEDIYTYLTGGEAAVGEFGEAWTRFLDDFLRASDGDPWWLEALKRMGRILFDLQGEVPKLVEDWKRVLGGLWDWIIQQARAVGGKVADALRGGIAAIPGVSLLLGGGFAGPAATPAASAASASFAAPAPLLSAPQFSVDQILVQPPAGASPQEYSAATQDGLDEWFRGKIREAAAVRR